MRKGNSTLGRGDGASRDAGREMESQLSTQSVTISVITVTAMDNRNMSVFQLGSENSRSYIKTFTCTGHASRAKPRDWNSECGGRRGRDTLGL